MRGFSLVELIIALAIATVALTAVAGVIYGLPILHANMRQELAAINSARSEIEPILYASLAREDFISLIPETSTASTTLITTWRELPDPGSFSITTTQSWVSALRATRVLSVSSSITQIGTRLLACDPYVTSDWRTIVPITGYPLTNASLLSGVPLDTYRISHLTAHAKGLVVTVGSTSLTTSPTLFFFSRNPRDETFTRMGSGFDNASTSRVGYAAALVREDGMVFAANQFGSASGSTCSDTVACAQVHAFIQSPIPARVSTFQLGTSTAPFAIRSGGGTAGATALAYTNSLIFIGLEKTLQGYEFNIIDAQNPRSLLWKSGIRLGRSVSAITIRESFAYVATDDPLQELVIIDISNPTAPFIVTGWNAPGSTGFGYGTAVVAYGTTLHLGRSFINNAAEFMTLDISNLSTPRLITSNDIGTARSPDSVRGIISQNFLTAVVTTKALRVYAGTSSPKLFATSYVLPPPQEAKSITCLQGRMLVAVVNTVTGTSSIQSFSGI